MDDICISPGSSRLTVATYGRGFWEIGTGAAAIAGVRGDGDTNFDQKIDGLEHEANKARHLAPGLYDAQWARLLLGRATERLAQEQAGAGKAEAFEALKGFLGGDQGGGRGPPSYEQAARALGVGVPAVTTLIHRLRQRHSQLVREEVARTVFDPAEIEAELHGLCEALGQVEGRVRP